MAHKPLHEDTAHIPVYIFTLGASAQTASHRKISTKIVTANGSSLPYATVELLKATDSSLVKVVISDNNGYAEFEKCTPGNYMMRVTAANYLPAFSSVIRITGDQPMCCNGTGLQ